MRYNFCTLFDQNYFTRGLALYHSLQAQADDFQLWILCMDDNVYTGLQKLDLDKVQLIRLTDLEDPELLKIKPTRSAVEYCWTLTPSLPLYILTQHPELDHVTYLDADTYFYSSPQPIYDEWVNKSILIVSHNYAKRFEDRSKDSGIFNVELLIFRNDAAGLECLQWWRERCNEWCYFRFEDGKLGDQMYLDDWPERFNGVQVLQHLGGGVAPWNIERFHFSKQNLQVMIDSLPIIFFHYHAFKWYGADRYDPLIGYYYCPTQVRQLVYEPYLKALQQAYQELQTSQVTAVPGVVPIAFWQYWRRHVILFCMNILPFSWLYKRWRN